MVLKEKLDRYEKYIEYFDINDEMSEFCVLHTLRESIEKQIDNLSIPELDMLYNVDLKLYELLKKYKHINNNGTKTLKNIINLIDKNHKMHGKILQKIA